VSVQTARSSIPKPPDNPGWTDIGVWIVSGSDLFSLIAAIAAGLGFAASVFQLFGPKPYSEAQGKADRVHQNKSFSALDDRVQQRFDGIEDQLRQIAEQFARNEAVSDASARAFVATVEQLAASPDEADIVIAEQAVGGHPIAAAEALLAEVNVGKIRDARRAKQAARLLAPYAPGRAMEAYQTAVELDPSDVWTWIELGRLRASYEGLVAARTCFEIALEQSVDERDRGVLHNEFGNILLIEGALGEARSEFEAALAIAERLASQQPGNAEWQRDLSVSYDRLGDAEVAAGNLAAAREHFASGLAIRERLAAQEPGNAGWQHDLSVSYDRLGDVEVAAGNLSAARDRFASGLAIRERLASQEPGNAGWQRDLSVSFNKLGDVEVAAGNLAAARERFASGLAIAECLASQEPGNAGWQRDLSVSYDRLGNVEVAAGNLAAARDRFASGLAIRERLASQEPGNADWQRDLWGANGKLGQLAEAEGDTASALNHYRAAESVMATLAARWPDHPGFARDLATVQRSIAGLQPQATS
jgi:tetratricopeptide (TPR) repeat protein